MAVLVKPTTWSAFCVPWAILFIRDAWKAWRGKRWPTGLLEQALLIGVPLLVIAFGWIGIAYGIKALNPNANFLLSSSLHEFNYGTWEQRFSLQSWRTMIEHCRTNIGPIWMIVLGLGVMVALRPSRLTGLVGVIAFLVPPLIFFNLYLLHDYYFYANSVFLILAIGATLATLWDRSSSWSWPKITALIILGAVTWGQANSHRATLLPQQLGTSNGDSAEVLMARALTAPDEVVVMHSAGWSSGVAYYSGRRFLTIPDFQLYFQREKVYEAVSQLADEKVTLLLLSADVLNRPEWAAERIQQLGFMAEPFATITGSASAHTTKKLHDRYQNLTRQYRLGSWEATTFQALPAEAPVEERVPIAETMWPPELRSVVGPNPEFGVIPFGLSPLTYKDQIYMMVHGGSELYFKAPPGASQFSCSFVINPDSFDQSGWDGIEIMLEGYDRHNQSHFLRSHLIESEDGRGSRTMKTHFEAAEFNYIRLRILPGLRGSEAFDHAWFSKIEFQ